MAAGLGIRSRGFDQRWQGVVNRLGERCRTAGWRRPEPRSDAAQGCHRIGAPGCHLSGRTGRKRYMEPSIDLTPGLLGCTAVRRRPDSLHAGGVSPTMYVPPGGCLRPRGEHQRRSSLRSEPRQISAGAGGDRRRVTVAGGPQRRDQLGAGNLGRTTHGCVTDPPARRGSVGVGLPPPCAGPTGMASPSFAPLCRLQLSMCGKYYTSVGRGLRHMDRCDTAAESCRPGNTRIP